MAALNKFVLCHNLKHNPIITFVQLPVCFCSKHHDVLRSRPAALGVKHDLAFEIYWLYRLS